MQPLDKDKAEFLHKSIDSWKQDNRPLADFLPTITIKAKYFGAKV